MVEGLAFGSQGLFDGEKGKVDAQGLAYARLQVLVQGLTFTIYWCSVDGLGCELACVALQVARFNVYLHAPETRNP